MSDQMSMVSLRLDDKTQAAIRFITERDGTDRSAFIRCAIARATAGTLMRYATEHGQPGPSVHVNMLADALPSQAA